MVDEWLQNELAMSFQMSSQCVSCEFKFLTGIPSMGWNCSQGQFVVLAIREKRGLGLDSLEILNSDVDHK